LDDGNKLDCERFFVVTVTHNFFSGLKRLRRSEFETTDIELNAIAPAAKTGFITIPIGANTPAAIGISAAL
jgi:hypothetical protein